MEASKSRVYYYHADASPFGGHITHPIEKLITAQCLTFVELDAEIRRLYAELDEIRARAKRKFYNAEAAAVAAAS